MSKEQYDELINLANEIHNDYHDYQSNDDIFTDYTNLEPLPDFPFEPYCKELNIILESKIFYNGQLKGRQLLGHAREYKSYQIIDLKEFIYHLCEEIYDYYPVDIEKQTILDLLKLEEVIADNIITIKKLFKKSKAAHLAELRKDIKNWLNSKLPFLNEDKNVFPVKEIELTDQIIALFKKHIPNAPLEAIYNGASKFLKLFGINVKAKTLSMRDFRKRKAQRLQDP